MIYFLQEGLAYEEDYGHAAWYHGMLDIRKEMLRKLENFAREISMHWVPALQSVSHSKHTLSSFLKSYKGEISIVFELVSDVSRSPPNE